MSRIALRCFKTSTHSAFPYKRKMAMVLGKFFLVMLKDLHLLGSFLETIS